ncbi:tetratricopeptide repeat protein [Aliikangiella maris]|uniref:Tetratricopeptide repeat protein n=2 Tax=Aliikangiella maris TaxID=3162458 RepID=A0ABV3MVB5_9GAMM
MSVEYIGIFEREDKVLTGPIIDANNAFRKYLIKEIDKKSLKLSIDKVKNIEYKDYFTFYFLVLATKVDIRDKELISLLDSNLLESKVALSMLYENLKLYNKSIKILENETHEIAKINYAWLLIRLKRDINKGKEILLKYSENNSLAKAVLGIIYSDEKKYIIANSYLFEALKNSEPLSYYSLGMNYYYGRGVEKNIEKAKELMFRARDIGDYSKASYALGLIFNDSNNIVESIRFLKEAVNFGEYKAAYKLGKIYLDIFEDQEDVELAIKYFELASENKISRAFYQLVKLHIALYNMSKDKQYIVKAFEYVERCKATDSKLSDELSKLINRATSISDSD